MIRRREFITVLGGAAAWPLAARAADRQAADHRLLGRDELDFRLYMERRFPIVVLVAHDPIGTGLVPSLARPGGNVTGLSAQLHSS